MLVPIKSCGTQDVDSHRDDVELGEWRVAHYSPGGWGDEVGPREDEKDAGGAEDRGDRAYYG